MNRQIHQLAAVLNSPTLEQVLTVITAPTDVTPDPGRSLQMVPVATMVKRQRGATYLFAVRMEDRPAKATFELQGVSGATAVEVLGEQRTLQARDGRFQDSFEPYAVHLYRIP